MKLAVSNIAWDAQDKDRAYALLRDQGVTGLEIAPGLLLPDQVDPLKADMSACVQAKDHASRFGLQLVSMQSLLFGAPQAQLFGDSHGQEIFRSTMTEAIELASRLGIPNLVLGSPKQRGIPEGMKLDVARKIWRKNLRAIGDVARSRGVVVALEPNPAPYGTNFMNTLVDTVAVIKDVDHPAILLNLDLGATIMTGEISKIDDLLDGAFGLVHHVHVSAPYLEEITPHATEVGVFLDALGERGWQNWISIEMRQNFDALMPSIATCLQHL